MYCCGPRADLLDKTLFDIHKLLLATASGARSAAQIKADLQQHSKRILDACNLLELPVSGHGNQKNDWTNQILQPEIEL